MSRKKFVFILIIELRRAVREAPLQLKFIGYRRKFQGKRKKMLDNTKRICYINR